MYVSAFSSPVPPPVSTQQIKPHEPSPIVLLHLRAWAYSQALYLYLAPSLPRPVDRVFSAAMGLWKECAAVAPRPPQGGLLRLIARPLDSSRVAQDEYVTVRRRKLKGSWWDGLVQRLVEGVGRLAGLKGQLTEEEEAELSMCYRREGWLGRVPLLRRGKELGKIGVTSVAGRRAGAVMSKAVERLFEKKKVRQVKIVKYVFVSPACRGRGLGEALVDRVREGLAREGGGVMMLTVDDNGSGSLVRYYDRQGWRRAEELEVGGQGGGPVMLQWVEGQGGSSRAGAASRMARPRAA